MFIDVDRESRLALQRSAMFWSTNIHDELHSAPMEREQSFRAGSINITSERQEKLGVSDWVKVPVEKV